MKRRDVFAITLIGLIVLVVFVLIAWLFSESQDQRHASCAATQTSLRAIHLTAEAGIRPVPKLPAGLPPVLTAAFAKQIVATERENERRLDVIRIVNRASSDLASSNFCK